MKPCPFSLAQLLPHAAPMILIDEVVDWSDDAMRTAVTIRPDRFFFVSGHGMPAHVAIEWMAQTCGAFVGAEAVTREQPVRIGFLLGTRDFAATTAWFREGIRLEIAARLVFRDNDMGVFDCSVMAAGSDGVLAAARLTVYQPPEEAAATSARPRVGQGQA